MSFSESLRQRTDHLWEDNYRHPFLQELGSGELDAETFRFYLQQGALYIRQYVKGFAMAVVAAETEEQMLRITTLQHSILERRPVHLEYMFEQGVSREEFATASLSLYGRAYIAHLHNVGRSGDLAEILAALLPCYWIYTDYAARLQRDYADKLEQNPYRGWMEMYTTERYLNSFAWMFDLIDQACEGKSDRQLARVERAFSASLEFEYLFWDTAYRRKLSY